MSATLYAVLLYPTAGRPRVVEVPELPKGVRYPLQTFKRRALADVALEEFLAANPEYRNWIDGRLETTAPPGQKQGA